MNSFRIFHIFHIRSRHAPPKALCFHQHQLMSASMAFAVSLSEIVLRVVQSSSPHQPRLPPTKEIPLSRRRYSPSCGGHAFPVIAAALESTTTTTTTTLIVVNNCPCRSDCHRLRIRRSSSSLSISKASRISLSSIQRALTVWTLFADSSLTRLKSAAYHIV